LATERKHCRCYFERATARAGINEFHCCSDLVGGELLSGYFLQAAA